MSTPQDPPRRRKQKARRSKQLAVWRAKHPKKDSSVEPTQKQGTARSAQ